ncbi:MAG: LptF/LptG family permease, partial [Planctomycetes bacterium]|nr:LptF/LptG family permease [Planctomycetota bacterium]
MKILDKYIAKNFVVGYLITFCVLMGLFIIVDLFINLDEFAEHSDLGTSAVLKNVWVYYSAQSVLWFRDLAGIITVVAATFSLARLTTNNELVAVLASGVSLKRVMAPIIFLAILLTGLLVLDQEYAIPKRANQLVRAHDTVGEDEAYELWFMSDDKGSLFCTNKYDEKTQTMQAPTIILRRALDEDEVLWEVTGKIEADRAEYNPELGGWEFVNGIKRKIARGDTGAESILRPETVDFYKTDLTPQDIPLRRQENYKSLLSFTQLLDLGQKRGTRMKDRAEFLLQQHSRITKPIINLVMLLVALPVLVCRDPKMMKTAIMTSFGITASCFVATFVCEMMATEVFLNQIRPELWA